MKRSVRLVTILLCITMLGASVISCSGDTGDKTDGTTVATTTTVDVSTSTEATTTEPQGEDLSINGKPRDFNVMVRKDRYAYMFNDGSSVERVDMAAYNRNLLIEDLYNVRFSVSQYESTAAAWSSALLASTGEFDLAVPDYWWGLELQGLFCNLNEFPEIDRDRDYWYDGWNDNFTINNRLYLIAGDAALETMQNIEAIFFNKSIAENHNIDLYSIVKSGDWTIDKMMELGIMTSANLDDNDPDNDIYGIMYDIHSLRSQFTEAGVVISRKNDDGSIELVANSQKNIDISDKINEMMKNSMVDYAAKTARARDRSLFKTEKAFMYAGNLERGTLLKSENLNFRYGIVCKPKYDKEQADYISTTYGASLFAIPTSVKDPHASAVILDALNRYSTDTVVTEFMDIVISGQVADSQDDVDMINILRSHLIVDPVFAYEDSHIQLLGKFLSAAVNGNSVAPMLRASMKIAEKSLEKLMEAYKK